MKLIYVLVYSIAVNFRRLSPTFTLSRRVVIRYFLSALFIFVCGCGRIETKDLVEEARALANEGGKTNWQKACKNLEICIKEGLTDTNTVLFYIVALYKNGDTEQAMKTAEESLKSNPENFLANYLLGKMYYQNRDPHRAFGYLRKSQLLRPGHVDSLALMSNCAVSLRLPVAKSVLQQLTGANEFRSSYLVANALGISYVQSAEYLKAISSFSKALKLSGNHPLIVLNLAVLSDRYLKNPKIARDHYNRFMTAAKDKYPEKRKKVKQRLSKL